MYIGAHVSISKGFAQAIKSAVVMGGNTLQFFTRNPRGGNAKALDMKDIDKAHKMLEEFNFGPLVAHGPYTYNLASVKPQVREFSIRTIKDDLERLEKMGVPYLVIHVGTHGGQGVEAGIKLVIEGLKELADKTPPGVQILLEGMAGEGTELGHTFNELAEIIEGIDDPELGVCFDSCHLTGAGYDLTNLSEVKKEIEQTVGLRRIKAFHLNDTLFPLGSRRDRHAKLGEGKLGLEVIRGIVCDQDFRKIPFILETPNDNEGYAKEIQLVKAMC